MVGAHGDTTKVEVESSCKWMYFLFIANGLQFFFFSNPIIIPKMVGAHSCTFKDIRFPIAKELMINNMSLTFSQYFYNKF